MGSGINNKINKFLCNLKNVKKRRNTRLEKCYGHVNIATAFIFRMSYISIFRKQFVNFRIPRKREVLKLRSIYSGELVRIKQQRECGIL